MENKNQNEHEYSNYLENVYTKKKRVYKNNCKAFKNNGSKNTMVQVNDTTTQYFINTNNGLVIMTVEKDLGKTQTTYEGMWNYEVNDKRYAEVTSINLKENNCRKTLNTLTYERSWKYPERFSRKEGVIYYLGDKEPYKLNSKRANRAYEFFEKECKNAIRKSLPEKEMND